MAPILSFETLDEAIQIANDSDFGLSGAVVSNHWPSIQRVISELRTGTVNVNELESSTVDLATELTNMVVAQNSYSANSKAFQTGSDMVTTLINMLK